MAKYNTVQREMLLKFLSENKDRAFTVHEIHEQLAAAPGGKVPGESTVYRLIKELVESGEVKRVVKGNSRTFTYQIVGGSCSKHLHMKCISCGKLCHMDDAESRELMEMILRNDSFELDPSAVLPGKCSGCRGA